MKKDQGILMRHHSHYSLEIPQHPIHARSCGFGNKDRRYIDPVPILQLYKIHHDGTKEKSSFRYDHLVVHCDLYADDKDEPRNVVYLSSTPSGGGARHKSISNNSTILSLPSQQVMKCLVGTSISNAYELMTPSGEKGVFFIFDDLSIRIEGQYRLKFQLIDVSLTFPMMILDTIYSKPFKVYSPKQFPGVCETTELSRCFASQGQKIAIRNSKEKEKGEKRLRYNTRIDISSVIHPPSSP
ncbi:velvet factor [Halteromyces radiatus]|uniref:velvet factor n=1 Tax=Halteromyces radiatus TaxID=101107 RepID=UPI0022210D95|nr:velvet factor [Halteromyces radiatus]KAI8097454.1 velvet factor [Halteromyces radiatus]